MKKGKRGRWGKKRGETRKRGWKIIEIQYTKEWISSSEKKHGIILKPLHTFLFCDQFLVPFTNFANGVSIQQFQLRFRIQDRKTWAFTWKNPRFLWHYLTFLEFSLHFHFHSLPTRSVKIGIGSRAPGVLNRKWRSDARVNELIPRKRAATTTGGILNMTDLWLYPT